MITDTYRGTMEVDLAHACESPRLDPMAAVAVMSQATSRIGLVADHRKVHTIDFEGRFHRSRGPLNAPAGPQGRPVICQTGGSPAGREFAARHADTVIAVPQGVDAMRAYRDDISERMVRHGRAPSDCKVLFLVSPVLGETDAEARETLARRRARQRDPAVMDTILGQMSYFSGIDFAQFDLDAPFPDLAGKVNGHQSSMARFAAAGGRTLRETVMDHDTVESVELVGSPDTVAAQMGEVMEAVGDDGFLIATPVHRRSVSEIADGLAPALRRRGLMRSSYPHDLFRDNLLDF